MTGNHGFQPPGFWRLGIAADAFDEAEDRGRLDAVERAEVDGGAGAGDGLVGRRAGEAAEHQDLPLARCRAAAAGPRA